METITHLDICEIFVTFAWKGNEYEMWCKWALKYHSYKQLELCLYLGTKLPVTG